MDDCESSQTQISIAPDSLKRLIHSEVIADESPVVRRDKNATVNACKCVRWEITNAAFLILSQDMTVTNAVHVGGRESMLLTLCGIYDFKSPSGYTDFFLAVQSSSAAGDAANKMKRSFVLCNHLSHKGFVFRKVLPLWEASQHLGLSRIHRMLSKCLACCTMSSGSRQLMGLTAADIRAALSINFSLMVAADERHSVFICLKLCWFCLWVYDAPYTVFYAKDLNLIKPSCEGGPTSTPSRVFLGLQEPVGSPL